MSIHDAIMALSPLHYWTFATTPGQLTVPDLVGGLDFSSLVNDGGGLFGPEQGTTAQRLFSDQIWTTAALGLSAFTASTWILFASTPATGGITAMQDFLGWGDTANKTAHGFRAQFNSPSNQSFQLAVRGSSNTLGTATAPWPQQAWHMFWWAYLTGTTGLQVGHEAAFPAPVNQSIGVAPQSSDVLWIQAPQQIEIAHLAQFPGVLNQTQLTTIGSQVLNWPVQIPINMPQTIGESGPVTISPTDPLTTQILANTQTMLPQSAQIPVINTTTQAIQTTTNQIQTTTNATHTDTQNIVNTLFPQLETPLNYIQSTVADILNGITTTITNGAGAVQQTLGDFFAQHSHDQFGVFNVTSGPTCSRIDWLAGVAAYQGLTVNITSWPTEWTFTTPDDGWSIRDLAVLTVWIGSEQQVRFGIHTKTFSLSPLPNVFPVAVAGVGVKVTPPNYRITVDWAGGVCGELLLNYLP